MHLKLLFALYTCTFRVGGRLQAILSHMWEFGPKLMSQKSSCHCYTLLSLLSSTNLGSLILFMCCLGQRKYSKSIYSFPRIFMPPFFLPQEQQSRCHTNSRLKEINKADKVHSKTN